MDRILGKLTNPYIFLPYVLIIFCDFLTCEIGMYDEKMSKKIFNQNKVNKLEYLDFVSNFDFYKEETNLTELIMDRLKKKKIRKKVSAEPPLPQESFRG